MTDIKIELIKFVTPEPVLYLRKTDVAVAPKNSGTTKIILHEITLEFATDFAGVPASRLQYRKSCDGCLLSPGGHEIFSVSVTPSLLFMANTNCYRVLIKWSTQEEPGNMRVIEISPQPFILVHHPPAAEELQCFVSFKDPQDLSYADLAKQLLARAGIKAYLARDEPRPGTQLWDQKIIPEIRASKAVAVIWTHDAEQKKDAVVREIGIAKDAELPVLLFCEKGVDPPAELPPDVIEYQSFTSATAAADLAQGIEGHVRRLRQGLGP